MFVQTANSQGNGQKVERSTGEGGGSFREWGSRAGVDKRGDPWQQRPGGGLGRAAWHEAPQPLHGAGDASGGLSAESTRWPRHPRLKHSCVTADTGPWEGHGRGGKLS